MDLAATSGIMFDFTRIMAKTTAEVPFMFELIQVSKNSFYIQSPSKIGLVRLNDTHVCLIDSGSDKEAGRKVRQILDANGWQLDSDF